jgi:lipopolysaccharide transport system ATP-binding protein
MKPIIKVENLGKQYRIGAREAAYGTLRETIVELAQAPLRRLRNKNGDAANQMIWALKDVAFEVNPGEVVGIIGQNGAGKSTLLKVLSRITEPTHGRVQLYGRVASLLEVGTGFHPELTGRENIYLNGAILGMKKVEIQRKFDEIVAFSEVEKFIDTPVKRYSTGMYLRLAFAVAAHLEPEILIVDEVLAVGDANFQRKCLDKMENVARQGRTVLFVSHNMPAIVRLCPRVILMKEGSVAMDGDSRKVAAAYLDTGLETTAAREWPIIEEAPGDDTVRLRAVRVRGGDGRVTDVLDVRERISVEIEYEVLKPGRRLSGGLIVNNDGGVCAFSSADFYPESIDKQDTNFMGRRVTSCEIPSNLMTEGAFFVSVAVYAIFEGVHTHAQTLDAVGFTVFDPIEGDSARGIYTGPVAGVVHPMLEWTTAPSGSEVGE